MSDVVIKRRPMIDLDEFERRLNRPSPAGQKDGDLLAELLRMIGDHKDEPHKTDLEPKAEVSKMAQQDLGEPAEGTRLDAQERVAGDFAAIEAELLDAKPPQAAIAQDVDGSKAENKRPSAPAPIITGDFAVIEAGLLGAMREQATPAVSETDVPNAFPNVDLKSERRLSQDAEPASQHGTATGGRIRSRRRLYVSTGLAIVATAGLAVTFGFNSATSGPPDLALIKADQEPIAQQMDTASSADALAQKDTGLDQPAEPSAMALDKAPEQTADVPQAVEKSPPAVVQAQIDQSPPAVPPASAQAPAPAKPASAAVPAGPDTAKAEPARADGALTIDGTHPQANLNGAPPSAPKSQAAASKPPAAKAAGRAGKPLKNSAAKHPDHGQLPQIANKAKATPVSPVAPEPAPSADPKPETPPAQPSADANGPFGFVQNAMNSLSNSTAKLFGLPSGSRP